MTTASKRRLTAKQEAFCLDVALGATQVEAYRKNYPNCLDWTPASVYVEASKVAHKPNIALRITELRLATSDSVATVKERKERLSEILRADLADFMDSEGNVVIKDSAAIASFAISETKFGTNKRLELENRVGAIAELNRMERIGQQDTIINNLNDNRSVTIIVKSEEGKTALERLQSGKLPTVSKVSEIEAEHDHSH